MSKFVRLVKTIGQRSCNAPGRYVVNCKQGKRTSGAICRVCRDLIPQYTCFIFKLCKQIVKIFLFSHEAGQRGQHGRPHTARS